MELLEQIRKLQENEKYTHVYNMVTDILFNNYKCVTGEELCDIIEILLDYRLENISEERVLYTIDYVIDNRYKEE